MKIGVKYCGGCNPRYDRVELVEGLQKRLEGRAVFVPPDHEGTDLILAVEGCATACADLSPFEGKRVFVITCPEDAERFCGEVFEAV
jgi:hypothetical protein